MEQGNWAEPQKVGGGDEEQAQGGLQRGQTQAQVDEVQSKQSRALVCKGVAVVSNIALGIACIVAHTKVEEKCDSGPVKLKPWFLGTGILNLIVAAIFLYLLYQMKQVMNEHLVRSQIYNGQGRTEEAQREQAAGQQAVAGAVGGMAMCSCVLCLASIFGLVWGILGFVAGIQSGNDENEEDCSTAHRFYWGIFIASLVVQCCCQAGQAVNQKGRSS